MNRYKSVLMFHMDPNESCKVLEDAFRKIYINNARGLSFENLYRHAYIMVLHKYGDKLYAGIITTWTEHLAKVKLEIEAANGDDFLEELNAKWLQHKKSLQTIRDIVMFMDRVYVPQQNKVHVYELGLLLWRDNVVSSPKIRSRFQDLLLDLLQQERSGEGINGSLVGSITQMFMDLGAKGNQDAMETPSLQAATCLYMFKALVEEFKLDCGSSSGCSGLNDLDYSKRFRNCHVSIQGTPLRGLVRGGDRNESPSSVDKALH